MQRIVLASTCAAFVLVAGLSGCAGLDPPTFEPAAENNIEDVAPLPGGLPTEPTNVYKQLGPPSPHWVMYYAWDAFEVSRHVILDADAAELKAHLSTGMFSSALPSSDGRQLYVADSMSHGPARTRRDYISVYDTNDYSLSRTLDLPKNRRALMGPISRIALVDDDRFLVVFNFTPGTGISVIDMETLSLVSEIETPGCYLTFPTGDRGVSMLCGDGRLLTVHLDAEGALDRRIISEPFFDPDVDPIMENGVEVGGTWYFPSRTGDVYPVDLSGEEPAFHEPWPLAGPPNTTDTSEATQATEGGGNAWLPGAPIQMAASNSLRGEFYVLMHPVEMSGGQGDFTFPGTEVWVYDAAKQNRTRRIVLENMATTIYVTADENPLLVASVIDPDHAVASDDGSVGKLIPTLEIYDAVTGEYLRRFADPGMAMVYVMGAPGSGSTGGRQ